MADETTKNGVEEEGGDAAAESFNDSEATTAEVSHLVKLVKSLKMEKAELAKTNEEMKEKERKLEKEVSESANWKKKAEELVMKERHYARGRAAMSHRDEILETEVSRLRQDLATARTKSDEANAELRNVKKALKEAKLTVGEIEKENDLLRKMFMGQIQDLKEANSGSDEIVAGLKSMIKEARESKSTELAVKEDQARALKTKVAELEADVANERSELEKEKAEKEALKEALKASEGKVSEFEAKLLQLQYMAEEAKKMIRQLTENAAKADYSVVDRDAVLVDVRSNKRTTLLWDVAAGATAAAFVGGIISLHYARTR